MKRGGSLLKPELAYETWGKLSKKKDNVILILTGLSANSHAASNLKNSKPGWWEGMVGSGKAIDTDKFYVVCVNSLGKLLWFNWTSLYQSNYRRTISTNLSRINYR